jgi:hypothetical protein
MSMYQLPPTKVIRPLVRVSHNQTEVVQSIVAGLMDKDI